MTPDAGLFWRRLDRWAFYFILAASLALNVYLGLKARTTPAFRQSPPALAIGTQAPDLYAERIDGTKVVIDWAGASRPSILYVFSPSCIWCQRNTNNFDTIVRDRQADYRIVGLSTTSDRLGDYVGRHRPTYPVYANPDMSKSFVYAQTGTPTTYLISAHGIVLAVWRGAYTGDVKMGIEAKLNVRLPGIKAD